MPQLHIDRVPAGGRDYWRARWTTPDGKRVTRGLGACDFVTRNEAERKARQLQAQVDAVPQFAGTRSTVGDLCATTLWRKERTREAGTVTLYRQAVASLLTTLSRSRLAQNVTTRHAQAWYEAMLRQGYSKPTAAKYLHMIRHLWGMALADGVVMDNPFAAVAPTGTRAKVTYHYVTIEDATTLIECARPGWACLVGLCRHAGLRVGEATTLQWGMVDLDKRRLLLHQHAATSTKKRPRTVPVSPPLHDLLVRHFDALTTPCQGATDIYNGFKALCRHASVIPWARPFHAMRSSCVTDWLRVPGVPLPSVAAWAGHSVQVLAEVYNQDDQHHGAVTHPEKLSEKSQVNR